MRLLIFALYYTTATTVHILNPVSVSTGTTSSVSLRTAEIKNMNLKLPQNSKHFNKTLVCVHLSSYHVFQTVVVSSLVVSEDEYRYFLREQTSSTLTTTITVHQQHFIRSLNSSVSVLLHLN